MNRTFEVSGVAGGQRVFHYYADEVNKTLYLEDKCKAIPDQRNRTAGAGGDGGTDRNLNLSNDSRSNQHPEQLQRKKVKDAQESWMPVAALKNIGDEVNKINPLAASARRRREYADAPKNEKRNRMILRYETAEENHIALTGIDGHKDSIRVVLDEVVRNYALTRSNVSAEQY